jgi:PAS domain S-box-containing protein
MGVRGFGKGGVASSIADKKGKVFGVEKTEKELNNLKEWNKEKLDSILKNTRIGIALTDTNNKFILVNPFFCELLGYTEDELKKLSFRDITYSEDLNESIKKVQLLAEGRIDNFSLEKRYIKKNRRLIWGKVNVSTIRNENGVLGNYVISLENVTEIKISEDLLRNSEEQLKAVLMSMDDAVCVVDNDNKIILINKALEKLTGFTEKQLMGYDFKNKIALLSEKKGEPMFSLKTFDFLKVTEMERGDGLLVTADNRRIPVEGKYSPIFGNNGKFIGGVIVGRDATENRDVDKMRTDFISLASHQLRTPLTGIKWFVELLNEQKDKISGEEISKYVSRIKESNERLIILVNDLLRVSRIESGKIKPVMVKDLSIKRVIEKSIEDQLGLIEEKSVKINGVNKFPKNVCMEGDETQMIQVFGNIINNAVKYSSVNSNVSIKMDRRPKNKVVVVVEDRGVGIPESQKAKLFERFFRGDNVSRNTSGSGLGLYVVKSMLKTHGGRIWIESVEGKGTKVFVELPIRAKNE